SCLVIGYHLIQKYLSKGQVKNILAVQNPHLVPPFLGKPNSSGEIEDCPRGYEWVTQETADQFMQNEKDLSVVVAVAKSVHCYYSLLTPPRLCLWNLIDFASPEQITAIVKAFADDGVRMRIIFRSLFQMMGKEGPNDKITAALQILSE